MKRRLLCMLLCMSILISMVPGSAFATEQSNNPTFNDVHPNDWFYDPVMSAIKNNLFLGTGNNNFSPHSPMTRAMYVTVLGRIAGIGNDYPVRNRLFSDVKPDAYYAPYVMWAVEKGITKGIGNNRFSPDSLLTYAKYSASAPLVESETPVFASALDQGTDFTITVVSSVFMTTDQVKNAITVKNISSPGQIDFIEVTGDGTTFEISGTNGFEAGATYKLTLNDERLCFQGFEPSVRDYNFTIAKEDVMNLTLSRDMIYIPASEISDITENGKGVKSLSTPLVRMSGDPGNNSVTVDEAVMDFSDDKYAPMQLDSQTTVDVGDYLAFYDGEFGINAAVAGYGCITSVSSENGIMVITYANVTMDQMMAAMDIYNTEPLNGEAILEGVDLEALAASVEQQARDSGFANGQVAKIRATMYSMGLMRHAV
ncbi:S-layer homology domain-containing protein [Clostridium thermosuccinogenes]|uniref:S-layer homology domain-containing protein n=1 Tax=Clostridium thermosuccinogenes TaxID=84032 RepID=UPI000CCC0840|nr:S-layer homology domain-containing protein [Pseudoclostridium thermosuccinogenes]PNT92013.1 hypothetical protein CDQ83_00035 [Pseudoclostridium thermosuccinogenes]